MTWVNSLGRVLFSFARWQHNHAQTPLPRETSMTRAWAVATARRPWAGLMCLHERPCVWLPFAAACCYTLFYLLMMPAARLVCQRPSSNFPYFRTPLANFLLSRPNSVEYGNSKTTTLLPSAKCTRPLFQGRTDCGERPSGWHDIVTCKRPVSLPTFPLFRVFLSFATLQRNADLAVL